MSFQKEDILKSVLAILPEKAFKHASEILFSIL